MAGKLGVPDHFRPEDYKSRDPDEEVHDLRQFIDGLPDEVLAALRAAVKDGRGSAEELLVRAVSDGLVREGYLDEHGNFMHSEHPADDPDS